MQTHTSLARRSFLLLASLCILLSATAGAAVLTVTNTNDSGPGSLAQAITDSNNLSEPSRIEFNIPGPGVHTISVTSDDQLMALGYVTIDGYTQPGAHPNTLAVGDNAVILIQIDGGGPASAISRGLHFQVGSSTVRGLSLTGFSLTSGSAIYAQTLVGEPSLVNVEGNFIGITPDGSGRGSYAGVIGPSVVGGTTPDKRNIISGNVIGVGGDSYYGSSAGIILGNYIGTDPSGLREGFGNVTGVDDPKVVGGPKAGAGNVISGNNVGVAAKKNAVVQGNLIGPFADGSPGFGNRTGIHIYDSGNLIGGLAPNDGNVIAYNGLGIAVSTSVPMQTPGNNRILSNSIFANADIGIDLNNDGPTPNDFGDADTGANDLQNFPIISTVTYNPTSTVVKGGLNSRPSTVYTLQFFSGFLGDSVNAMAKTLLGNKTVTTGRSGDAFFQFTFPVATTLGYFITATATDPTGNTSELFPPGPQSQLVNLSGRGNVGTGDKVMIAGFSQSGYGSKRLLIRALGPSLGQSGTLADPKLDVIDANGNPFSQTSNDNWRDSQEKAIEATGLAPSDDREAALIYVTPANISSPAFTAVVSGANGGTGIAMVEIYDLEPSPNGPNPLVNLSTRAEVGTGDDVLIGGVILRGGGAAQTVVVRAIGPDLARAGVAGALQDPTLELYDSNGSLVASNDDWRSDPQAKNNPLPPNDDRDSAIVTTLLPTSYTAIVRGKNNSTGIALVEFYKID